jgi:hypothetical protein
MRYAPLFMLRSIVCVIGFVACQPAQAGTILERRYTFDKLDQFWLATLAAELPQASWFEPLAAPAGPAPVSEPPPSSPATDVPFEGIIIGETRPLAGAAPVRRAFPVVAMADDVAPILNKRLALLEIYLSRYRDFERGQRDTAEQLDQLLRRQLSAATELSLIVAMLYFAEPTLQAKCTRLQRLVRVQKEMPANLPVEALEPAWRPLSPVLAAARARLDADAMREMVCAVEPVRTRGEMQRIVTTRVGEHVMREVDKKTRDALTLLNKAGEEFQALVNGMDVPIKSAEILELERLLGNVESNLLLVKNDELRASATIAEVQAVDLSTISQPGDMREYEAATASQTLMVSEIDAVLEATAELSATSQEPSIRSELAVCDGLGSLYDQLDLTRDTATVEAGVLAPYAACLAAVDAVVRRFQAPSLDQAFAAELSRNVRQISEAFLQGGN